MLDIHSIRTRVKEDYPPTAIYYINAFENTKMYCFDTETSLLKDGQNIYVDIPEFVLGSFTSINHAQPTTTNKVSVINAIINKCLTNLYLVVGHNIAFDLNSIGIEYIPPNALIWDTALYEYITSSQYSTFPSLEYTHKEWVKISMDNPNSGKIKGVSEAIKAGVEPKDIAFDDLKEYCEQDVRLTKEIFISQFYHFNSCSRPYQEMIINQMHWLKNIYNMSKSGLKIDVTKARNSITFMAVEELRLSSECNSQIETWVLSGMPSGWTPTAPFNCMSNKQLQTILFGGIFEGYVNTPDGTYKTGPKKGQPKYKKIFSDRTFPGVPLGSGVKRGVVDSDNIKAFIKNSLLFTSLENFLENILLLRDISKTKNTYFEGYLKYTDKEGFIHSEMKHVGTPTGRLSSTKPNIQNLKGDE